MFCVELLADRLGDRAVPNPFDPERVARHESAHATSAMLTGFGAELAVELSAGSPGWCRVIDREPFPEGMGGPPDGRPWDRYCETRAVISASGPWFVGPVAGRADIERIIGWRRQASPDARAGFVDRVLERTARLVSCEAFGRLSVPLTRALHEREHLDPDEVDAIAAEVLHARTA